MILRTSGVSKTFGSLVALEDVDMSVEQGEIFGIAGPNGAGKSTLFNVIAGVFPPSAGKVSFDGHDITKLMAHQICRLGVGRTFQIPKTFPTLSVYENLKLGATFGGGAKGKVAEEQAEETMEFLGLSEVRNHLATNLDLYTTKLSMLGTVLATNCKLLLLDEPLGGLSGVEIDIFLELILEIKKERSITTIIIEHILDSLFQVSERMLILDYGKVIYVGDPEGVREDKQVVEVYLGKDETI
jgi:branched-chain amino acid transport system ATP-binding protein